MNTTKQIQIMIALVMLLVGGLIAYTVWEPTRAENAEERLLEEQVERGGKLFARNCSSCHGLNGEGFVGPALNVPENRPTDAASLARLQDQFSNTIDCGRTGTFMPAWAQDQGGPLNEVQVEQLVLLITSNISEEGWAIALEEAEATHAQTIQPTPDQINQGACGQVLRAQPTAGPSGPVEAKTQWDVVMADNSFDPNAIGAPVGQDVTVNLTNEGKAIHNMRIAGADGEFDTDDDVVSDPDLVRNGGTATLVFKFDAAGTVDFRCDFHVVEMTGTIIVQ